MAKGLPYNLQDWSILPIFYSLFHQKSTSLPMAGICTKISTEIPTERGTISPNSLKEKMTRLAFDILQVPFRGRSGIDKGS